MIRFRDYVLIKENVIKTPDELHSMSPEDFANYADSLIVGIKNKDRIFEILENVFYDVNDNYTWNNYRGMQLWDGRRLISKIPPNSLKFKKLNDNNSSYLNDSYEYIANVNGVPYGLNRWEDPDYDPYGTREDDEEDDGEDGESKTQSKYVWAYGRIGTDDMQETIHNTGYGNEDVMKEMLQDLEGVK